jgi:hypothetical protein
MLLGRAVKLVSCEPIYRLSARHFASGVHVIIIL